jgi:Domain of unknown function (DUF4878)
MNSFSSRFFFLLIGIGFSACHESPESVALAYSKALGKADYKLAQKYCTPPTAKLMGELERMLGKNPLSEKEKKKSDLLVSATCTLTSPSRATCTMCCGEDGQPTSENIPLLKDSTRWLSPWRVHLEKTQNQ